MKLVYICSPLRGNVGENMTKATAYCAYAAKQGVIPLAPHTIFTQYLHDEDPPERQKGLQMGLELLKRCDELWVCGDHISEGMEHEIDVAREQQIPTRYLSEAEMEQRQRPPDELRRQINDIQSTCGPIFVVRTEGQGVTSVILPEEAFEKYREEELKEIQSYISQTAAESSPEGPAYEQGEEMSME